MSHLFLEFSPTIRLASYFPQLTDIMYEALYLALHAPVPELHLTQLVRAHDDLIVGDVVLPPVLLQRAPASLVRDEDLGILLPPVVSRGDGVFNYVQDVCKRPMSRVCTCRGVYMPLRIFV